jgi:hypothetical protein
MAICPHCKDEIDSLRQTQISTTSSIVCLSSELLSVEDVEYFQESSRFECPLCEELITEDEQEALNFLKGEEINASQDK